ncbi:class I SAM-dependent methyltransferase [Rhizobium paknamense]|uniref:Class I SAM-dependent methyltransferase n=2 Tax=Rhizobium paknamense TaxID=1206817 RepID=A0ABU0IJC6_9HYPH|nr:class I SAM-dependent methyltransferase [Rhizobium paknamense]MDQ0458357.1 hypothetical protein [Rhizobium paknamense]
MKTKSLPKTWNGDVRNFWSTHSDRLYQFYVLPKIVPFGAGKKVLEIGAEYYSRYIKPIYNSSCSLSLLDIKPYSHPDIKNVLNVDRFIHLDMTVAIADYAEEFDIIISFGVLSHYNFSELQCELYLDNLLQMLKPCGMCAIKIDVQIMEKLEKFSNWEKLLLMIKERFSIQASDTLYDSMGLKQFIITYCSKEKTDVVDRNI